MIVVDASVILHALTIGSGDPDFIDSLESKGELFAPEVIYLEVLSGLRRQARLNQLGAEITNTAIHDLRTYPINVKPIDPFILRIWQLRDNITTYDAAYVALAESLSIPFFTRDQKLIAAIKAHTNIELI